MTGVSVAAAIRNHKKVTKPKRCGPTEFGVDDEFVTITRAPLPGHTSGEDKGDEEQQAAQ